MAFTSCRRSWITGRPSWEAQGINGSNWCHWLVVRSEGERRPSSRLMSNIPFSIALGAEEVLLSFLYRQGSHNQTLSFSQYRSCVRKKDQTRWVWTAMCRRTRQIVAFVMGDRRKATCFQFWQAIPYEYKHCPTFSDFWHAYHYVFPAETHRCVGKETGETARLERWNNTLHQRVGR
jgi:insertion element IS1 protein InsB